MTHLEDQAQENAFHDSYDNLAPNDEHWIWDGFRDSSGFPQTYVDNKRVMAQRVAYCIGEGIELHELPPSSAVLPRCFKPLDCVNPAHMELMTDIALQELHDWYINVWKKENKSVPG